MSGCTPIRRTLRSSPPERQLERRQPPLPSDTTRATAPRCAQSGSSQSPAMATRLEQPDRCMALAQAAADARSAAISAPDRLQPLREHLVAVLPRRGGALRYVTGDADRRIGWPPAARCWPAAAATRCACPRDHLRVGEHRVDAVDRPAGHAAARRATIHRRVVRSTVAWRSSGIRTPRFATRCALVAKRASAPLGMATAQNLPNWPSLPTARIMSPSAVGKSWYGTMFGCALPMRRGDAADQMVRRLVGEAWPPARRAARGRCCWPVRRSRARRARMHRDRRVQTGRDVDRATPTFCGPGPARHRRRRSRSSARPCPGSGSRSRRAAWGPVWPKPVIEQTTRRGWRRAGAPDRARTAPARRP